MKRFYIKTFFFILPIIIFAIPFEFAVKNIPNDYSYKKAYLNQNSSEIETLILGSSHAYYGLDPVYFDSKTFNAAYVSQTLDYDNEIFERYKGQMVQLKSVIVVISYFSMFDVLHEGRGEGWRIKYYLRYCDIGTGGLLDKIEIFGRKLYINMGRFVKYYLLRKSTITTTELGWGTSYKSENAMDLDETGKETAIRHTFNKINLENTKNIESILDSMIAFCKTKNIHVALLTLPAYKSYRDNLNNEQLKLTLDFANNIAQRHQNCTYINMLADSYFTYEDFYDGDHLNEIGAKKLSLKVNKMLEELNEKSNLVTNSIYVK